MTGATDIKRPPRPKPASRLGLRLRLWLGCLGGTLVTGLGLWWVLPPRTVQGAPTDHGELLIQLTVVFIFSLVTGIVLAAWLDHGIMGRMRALTHALEDGVLVERPGRPWSAAWGELADLAHGIETLLGRQRQMAWSVDELERLKAEIDIARESVELWAVSERWGHPAVEEGALLGLLDPLSRGFRRQREVFEQNQQAARQIQTDLLACLDVARASAEQAEHGFLEATAALTTINELQRTAAELYQRSTEPPAEDLAARPAPAWRSAATAAIEELVSGAGESVEHLSAGFLRVREIGEQVHLLSNRATLIALHTMMSGVPSEESTTGGEGLYAELKQLALEVRSATSRVAELSRDLEREIQSASARMRGIRERVASRLEEISDAAEPAPEPRPSDEVRRLLERLREMVQDAARKSERVTGTIEGASRAAQDLIGRLQEEVSDLDGLTVRLSPPTAGQGAADATGGGTAGEAPRSPGLRILQRDDRSAGDVARERDEEERA